jgi:hypothetical protein
MENLTQKTTRVTVYRPAYEALVVEKTSDKEFNPANIAFEGLVPIYKVTERISYQ